MFRNFFYYIFVGIGLPGGIFLKHFPKSPPQLFEVAFRAKRIAVAVQILSKPYSNPQFHLLLFSLEKALQLKVSVLKVFPRGSQKGFFIEGWGCSKQDCQQGFQTFIWHPLPFGIKKKKKILEQKKQWWQPCSLQNPSSLFVPLGTLRIQPWQTFSYIEKPET